MRRVAPLAVLTALLVSGCGSKPLSSGELHSRATQLCLQAGSQTDRIRTPASPPGTVAFLQRGIAVMTPELAKLRALRPARGDVADVYSTSVHTFSEKLRALERTVRELNSGEDPVLAIKGLQRKLKPLESQENGAWQALQIPACQSR
jgi:hypothetical protein